MTFAMKDQVENFAEASSIKYVSAEMPLEEICKIIDRDGAVVIKQIMSPAVVEKLKQEIGPQLAEINFGKGKFVGQKTRRLHGLVAKSETAREIAINPLILNILEQLFLGYCDTFQITYSQAIQIWPGEREQLIHTDDDMYPIAKRDYNLLVNVMFAYDDFTKENGATVLYPGTHKLIDRNHIPRSENSIQAEMKSGDVLIFCGSLYHHGGANRSDKTRTGLLFSYALGWLRQYENQYLVAPPAVAKHYSKELRKLLGYTIHRPQVGQYEGNDPSVLLEDVDVKTLATQDLLPPIRENLVSLAQKLQDDGIKFPENVSELISMLPSTENNS